MEIWNTRNLKAPPTLLYKANPEEVDIVHLRTILEDGIKFYQEQALISLETSLLARIVYRMKSKFRSSKDFQSLEKVKKDLMTFQQLDIVRKLKYFVSLLPVNLNCNNVCLPTKNMIDFILVQLQGIGKLLNHTREMCITTAKFYEYRFHLGHFWKMALIAFGLVSRINVIVLNIIKFTTHLYLRILPFSYKLKNLGVDWLPRNYVFPKDLKDWLEVEWTTSDEVVIEVDDAEFDISLIDLVDDSDDDDVEFCNEYIEVDDEDLELIKEFTNLKKKKIPSFDMDKGVTILRGFASDNVDIGEEILSNDGVTENNDHMEEIEEQKSGAINTEEACCMDEVDHENINATMNEENNSFYNKEAACNLEQTLDMQSVKIIEDTINDETKSDEKMAQLQISSEIYISSDEESEAKTEDSDVQIIEDTHSEEKFTEEFILLDTVSSMEACQNQKTNIKASSIIKKTNETIQENDFITEEFISLDSDKPLKTYVNVEKVSVEGVSSKFERKKRKRKNREKSERNQLRDELEVVKPKLKRTKRDDSYCETPRNRQTFNIKGCKNIDVKIKKENNNNSFFENIQVTSTPLRMNFGSRNDDWETTPIGSNDMILNISGNTVLENAATLMQETSSTTVTMRKRKRKVNKNRVASVNGIEKLNWTVSQTPECNFSNNYTPRVFKCRKI